MNRFRFLVFLAAIALFQSASAQAFADFKLKFWQQLSETCAPGLRWEKSVTEFAQPSGEKTETKTFDLDCYHGYAKSEKDSLALRPEEFALLFEYAYDNAHYAPYMDVEKHGNSIEAFVKPGREDESKLQMQMFSVDAETGKLRYAEAKILKDSPLYDLEVHIVVWFDESGHYERHEIETKTDVLLGGELHTKIIARLL